MPRVAGCRTTPRAITMRDRIGCSAVVHYPDPFFTTCSQLWSVCRRLPGNSASSLRSHWMFSPSYPLPNLVLSLSLTHTKTSGSGSRSRPSHTRSRVVFPPAEGRRPCSGGTFRAKPGERPGRGGAADVPSSPVPPKTFLHFLGDDGQSHSHRSVCSFLANTWCILYALGM